MSPIALIAQPEASLRAELVAAAEALGWEVLDAAQPAELQEWAEEAGLLIYDPGQGDPELAVRLRFAAYAQAPEEAPASALHAIAPFEPAKLQKLLPPPPTDPAPAVTSMDLSPSSSSALPLDEADIDAQLPVDPDGPTELAALPGEADADLMDAALAEEASNTGELPGAVTEDLTPIPKPRFATGLGMPEGSTGAQIASARSLAGAPTPPPPPRGSTLSAEALATAALDGAPDTTLSAEALAAAGLDGATDDLTATPGADPGAAGLDSQSDDPDGGDPQGGSQDAAELQGELRGAAGPGLPPPPPSEPEPEGLEEELPTDAAADAGAEAAADGAGAPSTDLAEAEAADPDALMEALRSGEVPASTAYQALDPDAFDDSSLLRAMPPVAAQDPAPPEDPDPTPLAFSPFELSSAPQAAPQVEPSPEELKELGLRNKPSGSYAHHRESADLPPAGQPAGPGPSSPVVAGPAEAGPAPTRWMPPRAQLSELSFARLLGAAYAVGATGALMLRRENVKKLLYFQQGRLISVRSNLVSECLGELMVRERLITAEERDRSLELRREEQKQHGQVLIEMGSISESNLSFALDLQLQYKLHSLFGWTLGEARFIAGRLPERVELETQRDSLALLYSGVCQGMRLNQIDDALDEWDGYKVKAGASLGGAIQALEPDAIGLLAWIDGTRQLGKLLGTESLQTPERRRLVFTLIAAEALQLVGLAPLTTTTPPEPPRGAEPPPQPAAAEPSREASSLRSLQTEGPTRTDSRVMVLQGQVIPEDPIEALAAGLEQPSTDLGQEPQNTEALQEELHARAVALERAGPLEIFGLGPEFSEQALASAYARVSAENAPAPDCVAYGPRIWAERAEQRVRQAYLQVQSTGCRARLERIQRGGVSREAEPFRVDRLLQDAAAALERGEPAVAVQALDRALARRPTAPHIQADRIWAAHAADQVPASEAIAALEALAEQHPSCVQAPLRRAQLLQAEGDPEGAKRAFDQALSLDPDLPAAQSAHWTLSGAPTRREGLFSRLGR